MSLRITDQSSVSWFQEMSEAGEELVRVTAKLFFQAIEWMIALFYSSPVVISQHEQEYLDANRSAKSNILSEIFQYLPLNKVALLSKEWSAFAKKLHYERKMYKLEQKEEFRIPLQIFKHVNPKQTPHDYHNLLWQHVCELGQTSKKSVTMHPSLKDFSCDLVIQDNQSKMSIQLFTAIAGQVPEAKTYLNSIKTLKVQGMAALIQTWYLGHLKEVQTVEELCFIQGHRHGKPESYDLMIDQYLPPEFLLLSGLKKVCFAHHRLSSQVAQRLPKIEEMSLSGWRYTSQFYAFHNLKSLSLMGGGQPLEPGMSALKNLEHLRICALEIQNCFTEICCLTQLRELTVIGGVLHVPKEIAQLKNLERLALECDLDSVADEVAQLSKLKYLQCSYGTEAFLKLLCNMTQLEEIILSNCTFNTVPKEITQLINLEVAMFLHNGQDIVFPEEIMQKARQITQRNASTTVYFKKLISLQEGQRQ